MLGERHSEREENVNSNSARRPEASVAICLKSMKKTCTLTIERWDLGIAADHGQNSTSANSNGDINKLSCDLNTRLSREMDEMMLIVRSRGHLVMQLAMRNCLRYKMP